MSTTQERPVGASSPKWVVSTEVLPRGGVAGLQRARMLAAMMEVCAELGAANVTVAHVVQRAGVSRRTFYETFGDREDCFLAAFDEALERASRRACAGYDPGARWVQRMRTALIALLSFIDDDPFAGRLLLVESLGAGPRALARRERALSSLVAAVDAGREEGKLGADAPQLAAEGVVGAVCSVLHSRLLQGSGSVLGLASQLMSMIVLPYLGPAAARTELNRPAPRAATAGGSQIPYPLNQLDMRLTYRTVRVLMAVAGTPGSSNRRLANAAGVADPGQISKLLGRLRKLGLVENAGGGGGRGEPNAWTLTEAGWRVHNALG